MFMNKAWFFGDSFTYGHGCRPHDEYYDKYSKLREYTWTDIVSEKLNLEQVNKGISGNATPFILKQVIENLSNFNKGDFIFLSDSIPVRLVYPTKDADTLQLLTTDIIVWPEKNKEKQHDVDRFFSTKEERRVVVEFVHQSILKHSQQWIDFYMDQFKDIQNYLLTTGVHIYIWSHEIWYYPNLYQSITEATQGEIQDGHWSWLGHKQFSTYILNRVQSKEYTPKPILI